MAPIVTPGTSATFLPRVVHNEIRDNWLRNSSEILNLDANEDIDSYCGPERNLDNCEVVFTFIGQDGGPVDFRCPAKPFLRSYFPLPSERGEEHPSRYCSIVKYWPLVDKITGKVLPRDSERFYWVLGAVSRFSMHHPRSLTQSHRTSTGRLS